MRTWILLALVGCGSVKGEDPIDAPKAIDSPVSIDAPMVCTDMTSITSCGPACAVCMATSDRETPTCNGTTCATACKGNAPRCTDNSCSRTAFDFTSQTLEGVTPRAPNNLTLAVRSFMGSSRLAIDVTSLTEVSFRVPVCLSGSVAASTKTLSARIFFDGAATTNGQYFVQASAPQPQTGAYLGMFSLDAGVPFTYTSAMSMSTTSGTTTDVVFQVGSYGAPFSGTIWFDDIKIE